MVSIKTIFQIHFLTHLLMSYEFEILKIYKFCNAFYFGFWTNPNIKIICSSYYLAKKPIQVDRGNANQILLTTSQESSVSA